MSTSPSLHNLPALPRDEHGPVFREPWEAHAFALAVRLLEAGCFSRREWSTFLSREIQTAQARREPDASSTYYQHWLRALERLCSEKGLLSAADMDRRTEEWRQAYLHTPHGQPIELSAGQASPACKRGSNEARPSK
jgi:nitrile hydratase accessory protein